MSVAVAILARLLRYKARHGKYRFATERERHLATCNGVSAMRSLGEFENHLVLGMTIFQKSVLALGDFHFT